MGEGKEMKLTCKNIVLSVTILMALYATGAESCCLHGGGVTPVVKNGEADAVVSAKQIDESIAALQRMKACIPPGQTTISIREIMVMQMEEIKKRPEYAKMPEDEKKRLDAAIETTRRPPAAADSEDKVKKGAATTSSHEMVELSGGTRVFFMPKRRSRHSSVRKGRK